MNWKGKIAVVVGSDKPAGRAVSSMLKDDGALVHSLGSTLDGLQNEVDRAAAASGYIDALFCDSTFSDPGLTATQLTPDVIEEAMEKTASLSWKSALYAVPYLKAAQGGAVVFITNNSARHQNRENVLSAICSVSVESITKNFASEVASSGIRICSVLQDAHSDPAETAGAAVFLASGDASYITGTAIETGRGQGGLT